MNTTRWVGSPGLGVLMELTKLIIRRTRAGNPICLQARKETADFYGWSKNFEKYIEGYWKDEASGIEYITWPKLSRKKARFGRQHLISRTASKTSRKATYSNQFRVTGEATIADLAKIAKFTDVDWNWMDTPSGERRSREKWLAIHEAYTQWSEGGGVSL